MVTFVFLLDATVYFLLEDDSLLALAGIEHGYHIRNNGKLNKVKGNTIIKSITFNNFEIKE
ncbi:hypothetical protein H5410_035540 [Solanum commersonii]|uniref:Uncharacterized protein n=1 Tax=Solanum commersonii TaxID=4109 RepID=A0A9J5Y4Z5_SOLCO|nr:hypothetical protein H5410_035540 [Solanum commersonii]